MATIPALDAIGRDKYKHTELFGEILSPLNPPSGCRIRTRRPIAVDKCREEEPQSGDFEKDHYVACYFPLVDKVQSV